MSNPATVFRCGLRVRADLLGGQSNSDGRVTVPVAALNEQGAVTAAWPNGITRTCVSCDHFRTGNETCGLANARPPARIIAFGCEKYSDDMDVPF